MELSISTTLSQLSGQDAVSINNGYDRFGRTCSTSLVDVEIVELSETRRTVRSDSWLNHYSMIGAQLPTRELLTWNVSQLLTISRRYNEFQCWPSQWLMHLWISVLGLSRELHNIMSRRPPFHIEITEGRRSVFPTKLNLLEWPKGASVLSDHRNLIWPPIPSKLNGQSSNTVRSRAITLQNKLQLVEYIPSELDRRSRNN